MIEKLITSVYAAPVFKKWEDVDKALLKEPEGPASLKAFEAVFENLLIMASALAGIAVFIMLLWAGFLYLFSGGDPEKIKKAAGVLTWAIIGLVVLIFSWFMIKFIEQFTGVNVTTFEVPG